MLPKKKDILGEVSDLDALKDLSSFEQPNLEIEKSQEIPKEGPEKDFFDFDQLDSLIPEGFKDLESKMPKIDEEIPVYDESEIRDSSAGAIPDEISREDIKGDKDLDVKLTNDQRKQIVLTLTNLPKAAEIKIAKAIISNKYSNYQLKPLIDSLIKKESPSTIYKFYEKITGDKSLTEIEGVKYKGLKFEERQKSFAYAFQKNIFPILSRIIAAIAIVIIILFISIKIIWPSMEASMLYKEGLSLIDNKKFNDGESKFKQAFDLSPSYKNVLKFARNYRSNKRYLAAEDKYDLATRMKPGDLNLALEFADFFRETKDFERSEKKYRGIINSYNKNLDAILGIAQTYYDWGEVYSEKLNDAKGMYLEVLDIDRNNKKALFGNLNIYIKQKNYNQIIKHYNYIENKLGNNVDPEAYSNLAEYFIDLNEPENIKRILDKAKRAAGRNDIVPEIDYQYARYNKLLNISPEERDHLLSAVSQFDRMKKVLPQKYEESKYQRLLSKVYNDLGENYNRAEKANPEAEKYYLKAISADPVYGKPYYNYATFILNYHKPAKSIKEDIYNKAIENYLEAEKRGYENDKLDYNMGWIYYRENDYMNTYKRIAKILDKQPNNSNLNFMIGTVLYRLHKYELAESILLDLYLRYKDLSITHSPLDPSEREDNFIMDMLKKVSNNLGAAYQKKYITTRNSKNLISATKYYQDSIIFFDKLVNPLEKENESYSANAGNKKEYSKYTREIAHINLRMIMYPDAGLDEPILYEDFPMDFASFL